MELIDRHGIVRPVCTRCHRVRVRIVRGTVCEDCREFDRAANLHAKRFYQQAIAFQNEMAARRAG
jgi:transposase-like protein